MTEDQFDTIINRIRALERIIKARKRHAQTRTRSRTRNSQLFKDAVSFIIRKEGLGHESIKDLAKHLNSKHPRRSVQRFIRRLKDNQAHGFTVVEGEVFVAGT